MKKYSHVLLWATGMLLLVAHGCVQTVEVAPPEEKQVFVKCILEKGKEKQQATLLYSGGIGDASFEPVTDAEVILSGPTRIYPRLRSYPMRHLGEGVYEVAFEPIDGGEYTLKVSIPGRDTLEATTTMPPAFAITTHIFPPEEWLFEGNMNWFEMWTNPWHFHEAMDWYETIKEQFDGLFLETEMPGILFRLDSLSHHHLYVLGRVEDSTGVIAPIRELATNHLLVDHINANGRTYHAGSGPAFPDTAQRPRYERLIKQHYEGLALHDGYLRIDYPENYDNGLRNTWHFPYGASWEMDEWLEFKLDATRFFVVVGDFEYNIWSKRDRSKAHPVLYFCSVSEEYDKYLRSVQSTLAEAEGDLLLTLYGEAGGYSNVHGGYGVFGAISTRRHDCDCENALPTSDRQPEWTWGYCMYSAYPALLPEL